MNTVVDIIKILAIIAVFLAPAAARAVKAMKEQAAKREAELLRRKAREEALRTGRYVDPVAAQRGQPAAQTSPAQVSPQRLDTDAKQRLQELARQRRAELERAAQAQQTSARTGSPTPGRNLSGPNTQPIFQPKSAGAPRPRPTNQGVPQSQRLPKPVRSTQPTQQQVQQRRQAVDRRQAGERQPQIKSRPVHQQPAPEPDFWEVAPGHHRHAPGDEGESVVHRLVSDTPTGAAAGEGGGGTSDAGATSMATVRLAQALGGGGLRVKGEGGHTNATAIAELRRAIVLREVFDMPVSLRSTPPV